MRQLEIINYKKLLPFCADSQRLAIQPADVITDSECRFLASFIATNPRIISFSFNGTDDTIVN